MSALTREHLQQELHLKQRQLDLIMAIDRVRDTMPEPSAMMTALVNVLTEQLQTDLCCICLREKETGELALKAIHDRHKQFGQIRADIFQKIEAKIAASPEVLVLKKDQVPLQLRELPDIGEQVTTAVISIAMKNKPLGMLVFARIGKSFEADDITLIKTAESQIDSAVIQAYEYYTLQQRNKELEVIYRVDNIRDQHLAFDTMLNTVLAELQCAIQAEAGFIMLYNQSEQLLELRATTRNDLFPLTPHYDIINRVATESLQKAKMVWQHDLSAELRSILCLPLILENKIIGVLGVINRYGRNTFDVEDRRLLNAIASQMDTAIFESLEQRHLREVLGRAVDPQVMARLLSSSESDFLNCERSVLSVLYADIRESTALAEQTEPELLLGFINDYLGRMTEVILAYEGTLDKFVGDEVMALFGAPFPQPDHALRAIRVALKMQQAHETVMNTWQQRGVTRSPIGVGIATGELIVGEIGCRKRTDYTVIGRAANLGARLCGVAQGGEIIISQATYDLVTEDVEVEPIHGVKLKGVPEGMVIYSIKRLLRGLNF